MKTRDDFVSNSSSCSFVIAVGDGFPLKSFISEACKNCLKHSDSDDDTVFLAKQNELNAAVLDFHLRASELMYLGSLKLSKVRSCVTKDDKTFAYMKKDLAERPLTLDERLIENSDERIVIEYDEFIDGMAIPAHYISYVTGEDHWNDNYACDLERQKTTADEIVKFAKNYSDSKTDYKCRYDSSTCFISRSTIWNTRALIAAGHEVVLDKWMDLDKLESMLKDGTRLFKIRVNNGGDGVDEDVLFTFGGWDGEDVFSSMSGIEVLDSEIL